MAIERRVRRNGQPAACAGVAGRGLENPATWRKAAGQGLAAASRAPKGPHRFQGSAAAMEQTPITDLDDLLERLDELLTAADRDGVDPGVLDYLRGCGERARRLGRASGADRRIPVRLPDYGRARLVTREAAHEVVLRDHSDKGFGLFSPLAIPVGDYARLDMERGLRADLYEGTITHCSPEAGGFRIGLEVVSHLRIGDNEGNEPD